MMDQCPVEGLWHLPHGLTLLGIGSRFTETLHWTGGWKTGGCVIERTISRGNSRWLAGGLSTELCLMSHLRLPNPVSGKDVVCLGSLRTRWGSSGLHHGFPASAVCGQYSTKPWRSADGLAEGLVHFQK